MTTEPESDLSAKPDTHEMRGLSRCWRNNGWHVYAAGPCYDTKEQAIKRRDYLDGKGIVWESQCLIYGPRI